MLNEQDILFFARPSLRRAIFFSFLYAGAVLYGRMSTNLDPQFNTVWWLCFGVLMLLLTWAILRRWTTSFIITNEEIQCSSGILARRAVSVPHERVTNTNADQSFLERILGLANLQIDSAGGDRKELVFSRILKSEAQEAARIIREMRLKYTAAPSAVNEAAVSAQ